MTDADANAPRTAREQLMGAWVLAIPATGGFLLALGLMLFPPSFDNDGSFPEPVSCGAPALFDREAFTKREYGSDAGPDELATTGCAEAVAVRQRRAVGALAAATPLGLLALALHLHRRTARGRDAVPVREK
ncbi:hypothetical protein [Streptomyces sp. 840.1]|uniref:hypothetical protein n=1 Tax=Streptomyces sp. 840.1 TaxID=2485152 RepID=UPI000F45F921|nr:hypothetical protein [Streptomyces sp. 840.1]